MLDFMVIGLPRSGTTWVTNWLTTDRSHCVHDPLYLTHYADWDTDPRFYHGEGVLTGVACTGIWRWVDWVNSHPARKLVIHRNEVDVNNSLIALGLPPVERNAARSLAKLTGLHVPHADIFDQGKAAGIWEYLLPGVPFNPARHRELVNMRVQPAFERIRVNRDVTKHLLCELESAAVRGC